MKSQVGPASKELTSVEVAEAFLAAPEVSVVYFGEDSKLKGKHQAGIGVVHVCVCACLSMGNLSREIMESLVIACHVL